MYLSKLTISGFQQFGQGDAAAELTFQPGVTALIGTNDSGKKAIIDAVFSDNQLVRWILLENGLGRLEVRFTGQVSTVQNKLHFAYDFCRQFSLCFQPQSLIVRNLQHLGVVAWNPSPLKSAVVCLLEDAVNAAQIQR
jgi:hypothetical protein